MTGKPTIYLIKNNKDGDPEYKFKIDNLSTFTHTLNSPNTTLPLPEEESSENVLIKIAGNSADVKMVWTIKDQATDQATRTVGDSTNDIPSKTLWEQWNLLSTEMQNSSIDDSYTLQIEGDGDTIYRRWYGTIGGITFSLVGGIGAITTALTFQEGDVITVYDTDAPSTPLNVTAEFVNNNSIRVRWTKPLQNEDDVEGYTVYVKGIGQSVILQTASENATQATVDITAQGVSGTYNVGVYATTATLDGKRSRLLQVIVP